MKKELRALVPYLMRGSLGIRNRAFERFCERVAEGEFEVDDMVALIGEAESVADSGQEESEESARQLLICAALLAQEFGPEAAPAIETVKRVMPCLSGRAKMAALNVLKRIPAMASFEACVELREITSERDRWDQMHLMILDSFETRRLAPEGLTPYEDGFLARLRDECAAVGQWQRECGPGEHNWKYEIPYLQHRHTLGIMLDVAGWWGAEALIDVVADLGGLTDPHLRLIRAVALMRAGRQVPALELEWIAQWPRERMWLREHLVEMGKADKLPAVCRDAAKLAEGHMVDWLCFGTELGREPDEMELAHIERRYEDDGEDEQRPTDYFFYRFRVTEDHWAKEDGWMVGMAGGFQQTPEEEVRYTGCTFSHFTKWKDATLREHIASFLDDDEGED